jgi:ubiquitin carboxyl-terminal hydrolase 7
LFDHSLREYHDGDLGFRSGMQHADFIKSHKLKKDLPLTEFVDLIANSIQVVPEQIRLWNVVTRQNKTHRVDSMIGGDILKMTLGDYQSKFVKSDHDIRLFVETSNHLLGSEGGLPVYFESPKKSGTATIFLKVYDPLAIQLSFLQTVCVNLSDRASVLLPRLARHLECEVEKVLMFEEIKADMVDSIDPRKTFTELELMDGDIISFQRELSTEEISKLSDDRFQKVTGYYEYLFYKVEVTFQPRYHDKIPEQKSIVLELSYRMSYDEVLMALGSSVGYDPQKIRLFATSQSAISKTPVSRNGKLSDMLGINAYANPSFVFVYELLEMSLLELESMVQVQTTYVNELGVVSGPHKLLLNKKADFKELILELAKVCKLSKNPIKIFDAFQSKKAKTFDASDLISTMTDFTSLIIESISDEELLMIETHPEFIIEGFHFSKDTYRSHGIPFTFVLHKEEKFLDTKKRLSKKLFISKNELERVKFCYTSSDYSKVVYLEDGNVLSEMDLYNQHFYLGIDHADKTKGRSQGGGVKINEH